MLFVCMAFFAGGSLACALANDFTVIIVGRTIKGVGGGGLIAVTEVVVVDLVPLAVRGIWFSILSAMWAIGTVAGPLIGAGFAQNATWRWIFWINLPITGIAAVMVFFFLNQTKIPGGMASKLARFDWLGCFLFTVGSTIVLFGITTGGVMYPWGSFRTLLPLILGIALLVVFAYWEFNYAKEPMINRALFNNRTMIASYFMTLLHGMILWSIVYFLSEPDPYMPVSHFRADTDAHSPLLPGLQAIFAHHECCRSPPRDSHNRTSGHVGRRLRFDFRPV